MPNSFDTAKYLQMSDADAEKYLAEAKGAGDDDGEQEEGGEEDAEELPAESDADAQPEGQEPEGAIDQGQGEEAAAQGRQTTVPHGAMHEERMKRREAEAEVARLKAENAQLAQAAPPAAPAAPPAAAADASGLMFEDPAAVDARVNQALANHPAIQELQQLRAEKAERTALEGIATKYGDPEAADMVAQFDMAVPQFKTAGLPLEARYFMAKGVHAISPEAQAAAEATAQAAGRKMAVDQKAAQLGGKAATPSTPNLAGIPPAAANGPAPDHAKMSAKDMLSAPQGQLDTMRRGRAR